MKKTKAPDMMQFLKRPPHKKPVPRDHRLFQSLMDEPVSTNLSEKDIFDPVPEKTNITDTSSSSNKKNVAWWLPDSQNISKTSEQNWQVLQPKSSKYTNQTTLDTSEIDIKKEGKGGWGDPHYDVTGSNGERIKFDHKGVDGHEYHLFSGDNINITGTYEAAPDPKKPQIIGNASIRLGQDLIDFSKDGKALLNGSEIENGMHKLAGGGTLENKDRQLAITPRDGTGIVDLYARNGELRIDPSGKFSNLDGIIGKAIALSRGLSDEECEAFDLTRYSS